MHTKKFRKIALMGRVGVTRISETLAALSDYLLSLDYTVMLTTNSAELLSHPQVALVDDSDLGQQADLLLVVGGDGSLLNAAHLAVQHQLPVLGINRGFLGFLTDIHPDKLESIERVLEGEYHAEERLMLETQITQHNNQILRDIALNDIVLLPGDTAQMIEFDIYIDEQFVCHQRADGLIIATPTGSTAYALSGGGPILHPQLAAMVLVPMFPHTLSSRPIVVHANSHIQLDISKTNVTTPHLSCDGQVRRPITPGTQINVRKKADPLILIHPQDYSYYGTLREKLGWENRFNNVM